MKVHDLKSLIGAGIASKVYHNTSRKISPAAVGMTCTRDMRVLTRDFKPKINSSNQILADN